MRRGNFSIQGEGGGSAEVSVIRLPANAEIFSLTSRVGVAKLAYLKRI